MEKKWSDELVAYTRKYFNPLGTEHLKNINGKHARSGFGRLLCDCEKALVPETEKDKCYILFDRETDAFVAAYGSLEDLIDAGWAVDDDEVFGSIHLKNINGGYAVAYNSRDLDDWEKASVPETEKKKRFILFDRDTRAFAAAYDSLEDLIDAGWVLD